MDNVLPYPTVPDGIFRRALSRLQPRIVHARRSLERRRFCRSQFLDLAGVLHGGARALVMGEQRERLGLGGLDRRECLIMVLRAVGVIADLATQTIDAAPHAQIL